MNTLRVLAVLALAALAQPASAAFVSHRYDGMVVAVDREARKLTVTDHRGRVDSFTIGENVEVKDAAGNAAKFEDITSFDAVILTYKGERVTKIEMRPPRQYEERLDDAAPSGPP